MTRHFNNSINIKSLPLIKPLAVCCLTLTLIVLVQQHVMGESNKAVILYNIGNFSGAVALLNKELAVDPHSIRILLDVGLSYEKMGNHTMSSKFFNQVLKEADSNQKYLDQRGAALTVLGDFTYFILLLYY